MDIDQAKKLSQDKIEADFLTKIVRRNIKRKELEKQQAREKFREAFRLFTVLFFRKIVEIERFAFRAASCVSVKTT